MMSKLTFLSSVKNRLTCAVIILLTAVSFSLRAQVNVGLTAVATQSGGGVTVYSPANYNDNSIVAFSGCSGYGTCPTPWGWVSDGGYIDYTWSSPQTFGKIVFYHSDRPMTSCTFQYWNGTAFVTFGTYTTAICNADSFIFTPVTTTILRFLNCTAPLINPNFREIQVWQSAPPPPTITGASTYCIGSTITLTASSTAPSPTFAWTGPGSFSAATATITIPASLATAGVYSCTVTSGGFTSTAALDTITVVPQPTITTGIAAGVCQGGTSTTLPYTATVGSPTVYNIVYSPAAIAAGFVNVTAATLPVSPMILTVPGGAATATYAGTLTVGNAVCTGPSVPISVTVNPLPAAITGYANTCTGTTTTLSSATPGGTWSSGNPSVAVVDPLSGIVTGVSLGTATITYTLTATGCYRTINVTVLGISGPNQVCAGSAVTLTSTSTGGVWSSSDLSLATVGSATGIVTGVAMGTVHITYTLGSGCNASWVMTVNPLAPILGRDSVCVDGERWLTDIVGGGTWSSAYPAVASVLPDSGKVTGHAAGITTISYTLPTGCMSTRSVTVVNNPGAISGTMQVCPGATTALANATGGGTWTSSDGGIAAVNASTGVVTGINAGNVEITYTTPPGCPTRTFVLVNPLPEPITGNDVMCPGSIDTVHDATPGGLWSSGSTPVATVIDINGAVTAVSQGVAVIKYTLATGCFRSKTIYVNGLPVPNIFYNFNTFTFEASPGYASYQWYDSIQGMIPLATSPTLAALKTEYYYVEVTDSNGCKGKSAKYYFDTKRLGIQNVSQEVARVYPNPATATINVEASVKVRAVICSIEGRKVIEQEDARTLDVSKLANGVYIITLYDREGMTLMVDKLVKE